MWRNRFIYKVTLNGIYTDCALHYRARWGMGVFLRRETEIYGNIHQRLDGRRKDAGMERERGLRVGGLPRTFKRAVKGS